MAGSRSISKNDKGNSRFSLSPQIPGNLSAPETPHVVYRRTDHDLRVEKDKAHYLNPVEKEMYETLSEIMDNTGIDEFFFRNGNLKTWMEKNKVKVAKGS